jgi:hypothetical protein
LTRLSYADVATSEYKGPYASQLQGNAFELAVSNSLVASKDNPTFRAGTR